MGAAGRDDPSGLITIVRIEGALPDGFDALRREAEAEGHRHLGRLLAEWADSPEMFHALLAAFHGGALAGICGVTDEPEPAGEPAWRMRRLYVAAEARREGVGRRLVNALLEEAPGAVRLVTVHAPDANAGRFWQAVGFVGVDGRAWSHELRG